MPDAVAQVLVLLMHFLEIAGAGTLVLGFLVATVGCLNQARQHGAMVAMVGYRKSLGRSVIIGLEILVAATIIKTIAVEPSVEGVGLLATMVAIRTFLSWTTVLEISGRWPWQRPQPDATK
jgi:uncharacterized membrane protein